jgi:hypothetical protein
MCAFAIFFFLYPSLLHFQWAMKARRRLDNMEILFEVSEIPYNNKIWELTGGIETGASSGVFMDNLRTAEGRGDTVGNRQVVVPRITKGMVRLLPASPPGHERCPHGQLCLL